MTRADLRVRREEPEALEPQVELAARALRVASAARVAQGERSGRVARR